MVLSFFLFCVSDFTLFLAFSWHFLFSSFCFGCSVVLFVFFYTFQLATWPSKRDDLDGVFPVSRVLFKLGGDLLFLLVSVGDCLFHST